MVLLKSGADFGITANGFVELADKIQRRVFADFAGKKTSRSVSGAQRIRCVLIMIVGTLLSVK